MSTSIDQAFIRQYEAKVHLVFQRTGAYLKDTVRWRPDVVGSSTTFQKIGTGVATTKARHGTITPMNQTNGRFEVDDEGKGKRLKHLLYLGALFLSHVECRSSAG